ncbi:SNF2 family DNA-dependent ATPase [Salix suchowensis]|nr:SNF2 family DNA-dependent ATPase [Salix suchowensis]
MEDWNDFNAYVAKVQYEDAPLAGRRAHPSATAKDIELCTLEFSEEERDVRYCVTPVVCSYSLRLSQLYDSFEKRSKIRLSKFIKERTLVKKFITIPQRDTDDFEDPTLLMASDGEKELSRAIKFMGKSWVNDVKKRWVLDARFGWNPERRCNRFLERSAASELIDFADMIAEGNDTCPVCHDRMLFQLLVLYMLTIYSIRNGSGRIIECGHELCFGMIALSLMDCFAQERRLLAGAE